MKGGANKGRPGQVAGLLSWSGKKKRAEPPLRRNMIEAGCNLFFLKRGMKHALVRHYERDPMTP